MRKTHHAHTVTEIFTKEDGTIITSQVKARTKEETQRLQALVRTLSYMDE